MAHNPDQTIGDLMGLDVTVLVPDDKPMYDASFDLKFQSDTIQFVKFVPGNFLEKSSKNGVSYFIALQGDPGQNDLVGHISQTGDDPGKAGSGILVTLVFRLVKPGCSFLSYVTSNSTSQIRMRDPAPFGTPIGVVWSGGNITVRTEGDVRICPPAPVL
jgi:hypothetical protein